MKAEVIASSAPDNELERLLALQHHDPHSILGAHLDGKRLVVRAFRPDATRIDLLVPGDAPRPMRLRDQAGLFEATVEGRVSLFPYQLEIHRADGETFTIYDPYSFMPTLGDLDLHLWGEQRDDRAYDKLGAHVREVSGIRGVSFAVWAPNARGVSVVGDFNRWDGRMHMMRTLGSSGIWELFIPASARAPITSTKFARATAAFSSRAIPSRSGWKRRPRPLPSSTNRVSRSPTPSGCRAGAPRMDQCPISIYEMHLGSWRRVPEESNRPLTYREMAPMLGDYVTEMGFTHVELLPVMEHPFTGSWGYQVSGYFAPTARYGSPDDFRFFVDHLHQRGIGVILDWVPAHFPKDEFSLGRFDGTALYEHLDPRQGEHPEWGTYVFNYGRDEVRELSHRQRAVLAVRVPRGRTAGRRGRLDALPGLRRKRGPVDSQHPGGRENLEAISLLRSSTSALTGINPGIMTIAEESTDWPAVSRPTYVGGLGFGLKWDMGWMHDTLEYFSKEPIHRRFHHRDLTFGMLYAYSENFVLPLSHDEVVYGKGSMLSQDAG